MPYVPVPRDLSRVEPKLMFGLTKRQLICLAVAAVLGIPLYLLTMTALGELAIYLALVPVIPCFYLGFSTSKDNLPPEKKILNYIRVQYILPRVRPYKTENIYRKLTLLSDIMEVLPNDFDETETTTEDNDERDNRNQKN